MHPLAELLTANNVRCREPASSRKRILQTVARLMCDEHPTGAGQLSEDELFDGLMNRERLGSTGLGDGVAIPHCRLSCPSMRIAMVSLDAPIDYEAIDGQGVDLLFVLVVPTDESQVHLDALASLAEIFADQNNRQLLRACQDNSSLLDNMQNLLNKQVEHSKSA